MAKRILVVDDELDFIELVQFHLRAVGHEVIFAGDGMAALNQARERLPDVILMDLGLPDLDGLTLCEILRRQLSTRDTPVIMVSALANEATRYSAKAVGACAFFSKPLDFAEFKAKLDAVLNAPTKHLGGEDTDEFQSYDSAREALA
jgi:DNA-binding response OmpR family regulator